MRSALAYITVLGCLLCFVACNDIDAPGSGGVFMRIYGGDSTDLASSLVQTSDGGFAIAGSQLAYQYATPNHDMLLLRTDADGNLLWRKTYGGATDSRVEDLLLLDDGGFLLVGFTKTDAFDTQVHLVRTDASGEMLWERMFGGNGDDFALSAVQEDSTGDFMVVGYTGSSDISSQATDVYPDILLLRVSLNGHILDTATYGGSNEEQGHSIATTSDGKFVIAGYRYRDATGYDALVIKVDPDSSAPLWEYYGITQNNDYARSILVVDHTIIWAGISTFIVSELSDIIIGRIADTGPDSLDSFHSIGGNDNDEVLSHRILSLTDGTYVLCGSTQSAGEGANDFYLFSVNSSLNGLGALNVTHGGSNDDYATAVVKTSDGYAIVGHTKSFSLDNDYDIALLRVNSAGKLLVE